MGTAGFSPLSYFSLSSYLPSYLQSQADTDPAQGQVKFSPDTEIEYVEAETEAGGSQDSLASQKTEVEVVSLISGDNVLLGKDDKDNGNLDEVKEKLELELYSLEKEVNSLKCQRINSTSKLNSSIKKLEQKKASLTSELEALNTEYEDMSSSFADLEEKLKEKNALLEDKKKQVEEMEEEAKKRDIEKMKIFELENELEKISLERSLLRQQQENSNSKLQEVNEEIFAMKTKEENSDEQIQLLSKDLENLQTVNSKLKTENEKITEEQKILVDANQSFQNRQLVLTEEKDHFQQKNEELTLAETFLKEKVLKLTAENNLLENEKKTKQNELETSLQFYKEQIATSTAVKEEQVEALSFMLKTANQDKENLGKIMEKERQDMIAQLSLLKEEIKKWESESEESLALRTMMASIEEQRMSLRQENQQLRRELRMRRDYNDLTSLCKHQELTINKLLQEIAEKNKDEENRDGGLFTTEMNIQVGEVKEIAEISIIVENYDTIHKNIEEDHFLNSGSEDHEYLQAQSVFRSEINVQVGDAKEVPEVDLRVEEVEEIPMTNEDTGISFDWITTELLDTVLLSAVEETKQGQTKYHYYNYIYLMT